MKRQAIFIAVIFSGAAIAASCASSKVPSCIEVAPPDIHLTGNKTVIERQIVGDYRELEKDAWVVSSVRTNISAGAAGDRELYGALAKRERNAAKLREYKDEGAVGETLEGFVQYIGTPRYQSDAKRKKELADFIDSENGARRVIFRRVLVQSGMKEPGDKDVAAFGRRFAEEQRAFAKDRDWIQDNSGKWIRK